MACRSGDSIHEFAVSVRNDSAQAMRIRVFIPADGPFPGLDILSGAHTARRDGLPRVMGVRPDNVVEPVNVLVFTDDCHQIQAITVGEGRTLITIGPNLEVSLSPLPRLDLETQAAQLVPVC